MKNYVILLFAIFIVHSCSKERRSDKKGEEMQEFVIQISDYTKQFNSDFIVIPQNGPELAFNQLDPSAGINTSYMCAVDGFGIEELFYNGTYDVDNERLSILRELVQTKPVMVADYVSNDADIADDIERNLAEGFICFPRNSSNYDYTQIPDSVISENVNHIFSLADAQNYLYLISSDQFATKQEMLDSISNTNFDVLIIDLFFNEIAFTSAEVEMLKTKANGAERLVICYMNIGSAESYRYYWQDDWRLHHPGWLKKPYEGYDDEIWVKFWKKEWQEIIYGNDDSYAKRIIDAGFDGVYLDNVEAYYFLYFD